MKALKIPPPSFHSLHFFPIGPRAVCLPSARQKLLADAWPAARKEADGTRHMSTLNGERQDQARAPILYILEKMQQRAINDH